MRMRAPIRRLLTPLLMGVALVAVLFEATIWRGLSAVGRLLSRLPFFAWLERLIDRLSPRAVIALFVVPFVPIIPLLKLGELWLITHHHYVWAGIVIVGAKVVGAAFSTRVFAIARPKMLQVPWFARAYGWVVRMLELGHRTLEGIPAWRAARAWGRGLLNWARGASVRLWSALRSRVTAGPRGFWGRQWGATARWVRLRRRS